MDLTSRAGRETAEKIRKETEDLDIRHAMLCQAREIHASLPMTKRLVVTTNNIQKT